MSHLFGTFLLAFAGRRVLFLILAAFAKRMLTHPHGSLPEEIKLFIIILILL